MSVLKCDTSSTSAPWNAARFAHNSELKATLSVTSQEFGSEGVAQEHQESVASSRHQTFLVKTPQQWDRPTPERRHLIVLLPSRSAQLEEKDQSVMAEHFFLLKFN